jgi:hypothetical protein
VGVGEGVTVAVGGTGVALAGMGDGFASVATGTGGVSFLPEKVQAAMDKTSRKTILFFICPSLTCAPLVTIRAVVRLHHCNRKSPMSAAAIGGVLSGGDGVMKKQNYHEFCTNARMVGHIFEYFVFACPACPAFFAGHFSAGLWRLSAELPPGAKEIVDPLTFPKSDL